MWFLVGVTISNMSNQFTGSREGGFTVFTLVRFGTSVSVHMILETCQCLEPAFTDTAFVRSIFRMRFHVPRQ